MTTTRRDLRSQRLLAISTITALLLLTAFSWHRMSAAQAEATERRVALDEVRALLDAIRDLDQRPTVVALAASSQTRVGEQVESAVDSVGLPPEALRTIDPRPPERVGDTQYLNQLTRIEINGASLRQILQLVRKLEAGNAGFRVRDLVIRAPENPGGSGELWNVEAVLTQTVFSPKRQ